MGGGQFDQPDADLLPEAPIELLVPGHDPGRAVDLRRRNALLLEHFDAVVPFGRAKISAKTCVWVRARVAHSTRL